MLQAVQAAAAQAKQLAARKKSELGIGVAVTAVDGRLPPAQSLVSGVLVAEPETEQLERTCFIEGFPNEVRHRRNRYCRAPLLLASHRAAAAAEAAAAVAEVAAAEAAFVFCCYVADSVLFIFIPLLLAGPMCTLLLVLLLLLLLLLLHHWVLCCV